MVGVVLCGKDLGMVGVAWTGAPWPGFRHSHAPGQGGGMAMLLCYLLAASSPTHHRHRRHCCHLRHRRRFQCTYVCILF